MAMNGPKITDALAQAETRLAQDRQMALDCMAAASAEGILTRLKREVRT